MLSPGRYACRGVRSSLRTAGGPGIARNLDAGTRDGYTTLSCMRLVSLPLVAVLFVASSRALADEPAEPPPPDVPELGPGVALGYENGLWAMNFAQALRLRIPFSPQWGMMVKAVLSHPNDHTHNVMPHYGGGRLEIFGG